MPQFAFKENHQGCEVIFILRRVIEVAKEWSVPVFVLDGDLHRAYDMIEHDKITRALQARAIPDIVVAAFVREVRRKTNVFKMGGGMTEEPVRRTRSLIQGMPSSPKIFNATLDEAAKRFQCMVPQA